MKPNYKFHRASSIVVPEQFFEPLRTGIHEVDDTWSEIGGIIPSQMSFVTGKPGSGKTTLCLAIGSKLSETIPVAFISLEMSDFQLAHQARKIPGFGRIHVTDTFDPVKTLEEINTIKPGLIIIDSLQKAARKVPNMNHNASQIHVTKIFTDYAKANWCPVMLIGHCDKAGNYKGPSDLAHDVDTHFVVNYDKELDIRTFSSEKNRFGGLVQDSLFGITRERIWIGTPYIKEVFSDATVELKEDEKKETLTPSIATDDLGAAVKQCLNLLDDSWNGSTVKATIFAVVQYLKEKDKDFVDRSFIKDPKKVNVKFKGKKVAHAIPLFGELNFGSKSFGSSVELGKIGYKKEQKFMTSRISKRSEVLLWIILHEWLHLYKGNQKHTNDFFDQIGKKFDWFKKELS